MSKFEEYGADEKARGLSLKLQEMFDVVESNKARELAFFERFTASGTSIRPISTWGRKKEVRASTDCVSDRIN